MSYKIIYHGSERIVDTPMYHSPNARKRNLDYGEGFYCTSNIEIAKEWANRRTTSGIVNRYSIDERGLNVLNLTDKRKFNVIHWLAILIHFRDLDDAFREEFQDELEFLESLFNEIDLFKYDVVIGYRADDSFFRFPRSFINGTITYEKLEDIYLNGDLGSQYVLISEKAFKHIKFVNFIEVEPIYRERYLYRLNRADNNYKEIELEEKKKKGTRIRDLMNNYDKNIL